MAKPLLRRLLIETTRVSLPAQAANGDMPGWLWGWGPSAIWAAVYQDASKDNPFHQAPAVRDAIIAYGDFNASQVNAAGVLGGHDGDWRSMAWLEAMLAIRAELDPSRWQRWRECFLAIGRWMISRCIDMDTFDGLIPNHGIWWHALLFHIGQVFAVDEFRDMAQFALGRVISGQTPDGCFREGQSEALMPGSAVTAYNIVSADAIDRYYGFSGDERAAQALDRAWGWYHNFLFPDRSLPPCLDSRQNYQPAGGLANLPAYWINKPQGQTLVRAGWQALSDQLSRIGDDDQARKLLGPQIGLGFLAMKFRCLTEVVAAQELSLAPYQRMIAGEACIRRRPPWSVALCGLTNVQRSSSAPRLFQQERQDLLAVHHRDLGLLIGSGHSQLQPDASSMVFYENGAAHYLHQEAYLKSTDALDTLLLRYGANIGALSVDSTDPDLLRLIFSIHGERGRRSQPGPGHPLSAMAARAHFTLRLEPGDTLTLGPASWNLQDDAVTALRLRVAPGQALNCQGTRRGAKWQWSIICPDGPWELRWPLRLSEPYTLSPMTGERVALVEALLHGRIWGHGSAEGGGGQRPTATFELRVGAAAAP